MPVNVPPGSNRLTISIPISRDTNVAQMNNNKVFPLSCPTAFISPTLATPTTSVVNTNGPTIIFISAKYINLKMVKPSSFYYHVQCCCPSVTLPVGSCQFLVACILQGCYP